MKIRLGFVSNSSSASFCIPTRALTPEQIAQIKNYYETAKKMTHEATAEERAKYFAPRIWNNAPGFPGVYLDKLWDIGMTDTCITGQTSCDNFDFYAFLIFIGVSKAQLGYREYQTETEDGWYESDNG